jgi:hypothetical protein
MVSFILSAWPLVGLGLAIVVNIVWVMALVYSLHVFWFRNDRWRRCRTRIAGSKLGTPVRWGTFLLKTACFFSRQSVSGARTCRTGHVVLYHLLALLTAMLAARSSSGIRQLRHGHEPQGNLQRDALSIASLIFAAVMVAALFKRR